ncbi:YDG/SRA domain-containing protein [Actinoplanes sp. CA-142083]|uniref:YDG/SRA domain-containing protein n=1 Tax=Actinoplanes sp. CA-142083 TaxID=3239903 RepID=UPI003D8B7CA5
MPERTYGEIAGFPWGATFVNRRQLAESRVHRPPQGGICGGRDGAESIVVSGGYPDDEDFGNELIYTGQGGQDANTHAQTADQELVLGNAGLARSSVEGYPVRVIRGAGGDRVHSPTRGLRYDGLFRVADFWYETRNGFRIWRFRLVALDEPGLTVLDWAEALEPEQLDPTRRMSTTIQRIVRNTAVAQRVKEIHRHVCQVCDLRIDTPAGPYAEAAHIRALGRPHNGPDVQSNVLCLCPNHHVMFDTGVIYINEVWIVCASATHEPINELRRSPRHTIDRAHVAYHRAHHVA